MLKRTIASSMIVLAGGMFATAATANTEDYGSKTDHGMKHGQDVSFLKLDQNGDGYISQSEFENSNLEQVEHDTLDTDNDGRINRTEFAAFEQMSQDQMSDPRSETSPDYRADEPFQTTEPTDDPRPADDY